MQRILAYEDDADTLRMAESKSGQIALHFACRNNHGSVVALLLSRKGGEQRLHRTTPVGALALHIALRDGANMDVLPHLLADCAVEQTLAQIDSGANALMMAAYGGPAAAVDMLLALPGAMAGQLEARTKLGRGAIDFARLGGNAELIARIEAAMGALPASSATTTTTTTTNSATSTSTTTTAANISPSSASEGPVPLTPFPTTPAPDYDDEFSETAEDPDCC